MKRTSFRLIVATASVLAGTASYALANHYGGYAHDDRPARIKSMSFKAYNATKELRVISTDGKTWNAFAPGSIPFSVDMKLETKSLGFIETAAVVLGRCGGHQCGAFPQLWLTAINKRDFNWKSIDLAFDGSQLPLGDANSIAVSPFGQQILNGCNANLTDGGPTQGHSFYQTMTATFIAQTQRRRSEGLIKDFEWEPQFPTSGLHWRQDDFQVKVVCDPVIKAQTNDVAAPMPDFKATDIKLFLTTFLSNQGGNAGNECRALRVTTRVQTTKAGGVDVRLWRKEGNGPTTNSFHSIWSSYDSEKNGYFADLVKGETFAATTGLQYMAEVVGGTFAPSTQWKDITVHCTGAGGGGLANDMPNTGEDPLPPPKPDKPKPQVDTGSNDLADQPRPGDDKPKKSWDGTVTLADSAGTKKHCPRKGQVMFDVSRNLPGSFKYKLSCNNGQGFGGSVAAFNQGNGVFHAVAAHDLNINRTRRIQCTLQEVKESGARVTIDKGSFDYTCNRPAFDPQADDLATPQNPPKPTHAEDKPDVSIFCKPGFMLKGKACVKKPEIVVLCKSGEVLKGKTCIKKPAVSILCKPGFMLKDQKCVKKPTVSILCVKGYKLVNNRCLKQPVISANAKRELVRTAKRRPSN